MANIFAIQQGYYLKLEERVLRQLAKVMIDLGTTRNYMNPIFKK